MNATPVIGETTFLETMRRIVDMMEEAGDTRQAGNVRQLAQKYDSGLMHIAFCGHFSAGKSSLINKLCGRTLLPSSPIPTSANVVTIRDGNPGAWITPAEGGQPSVVPLDDLERYCKDGERIAAVDILAPLPLLRGAAALLDTPGIDSTDEAHLRATESALHLADVVFYVMDYNHVQSEINFAFTKRLKEWGKPLYLIVNQIDKHRERELPFTEYRQSVDEAFAHWRIVPDGIFYVSVKSPDHPLSEWDRLVWTIERLIENAGPLREACAVRSLERLIGDHGAWFAAQNELEKRKWREAAESEDARQALERCAALDEEIGRLVTAAEADAQTLKKEITALLENANIMPAVTREKAAHYLQSRKPGFKVGLFARAAATAKEIEKRLAAFHADFAENVRAHTVWHLRDMLIRAGEPHGIGADRVDAELSEVSAGLDAAWLAAQVREGASFDGEYTINYAKLIAAETKSAFRRAAFALVDAIAAQAAARNAATAEGLKQEREALNARLAARRQLEEIESRERAHVGSLLALVADKPAALSGLLPDLARYERPDQPVSRSPSSAAATGEPDLPPVAVAAEDAADVAGDTARMSGYRAAMASAADKLGRGAELLRGIPAMQSTARSLADKAKRLRDSTFTIALFGAFSAGKSSFANALLGESVLPVSPNPTTAAISKIVPPNEQWPHGSARIKLKTADAVLDDVRLSLGALGGRADDWETALKAIERLSPDDVPPGGKPHLTFLRAVGKGWAVVKDDLGGELRTDISGFRDYVAEESRSCFVEFAELFFRCPLTDQGITLVDTPGADSINARHTGVAFNYIKNADAILFVTYYNHAFSQADREFLLQLGRVKDGFELDKMFFIVNAADLAESREQLEVVVAHVADQLNKYGIRKPRMYPVSSLMALDGKTAGDQDRYVRSGIARFVADFERFAVDELAEIAVHAARRDLKRTADQLAQWIDSAAADENERAERANRLREAARRADERIARPDTEADVREAAKEIRELLYYVKQRLFFRFGELYAYAFNASTVKGDGAGQIKSALRTAWHELQRLLAYQLSQELLATTLRIENALHKMAEKQWSAMRHAVKADVPSFEPEPYEAEPFATPAVDETLDAVEPDAKWLFGFYKNGKHFFEGEGRQSLKDALEEASAEPVAKYLDRHAERFEAAYAEQYRDRIGQLAERFRRSLSDHADGLLAALQTGVDVNALRRTEAEFRRLEAL